MSTSPSPKPPSLLKRLASGIRFFPKTVYRFLDTWINKSTSGNVIALGGCLLTIIAIIVAIVTLWAMFHLAGEPRDPTAASPITDTAAGSLTRQVVLYRTNDTLTLYLSHPVDISTLQFNVTGRTFSLAQYPSFQNIEFGNPPAPACFVLRSDRSQTPLETICDTDLNNNVFVHRMPPSDVFWFDPVLNSGLLLDIMLNGASFEFCPALQPDCPLSLP
jgi:hypothetical protein